MAVVIDTIQTVFKSLFTVKLSHEGYEKAYVVQGIPDPVIVSALFQGLAVVPDEATKELFINHKIDLRCSNNLVSCFIRARGQQAYITIPGDAVIRLLLKYNSDFLQKTNVKPVGANQVYFFSNTVHTIDSGINYIAKNPGGVDDADLVNVGAVKPDEKCAGVIDMLVSETASNYRLLDGGILQSPAFAIRFIKK